MDQYLPKKKSQNYIKMLRNALNLNSANTPLDSGKSYL